MGRLIRFVVGRLIRFVVSRDRIGNPVDSIGNRVANPIDRVGNSVANPLEKITKSARVDAEGLPIGFVLDGIPNAECENPLTRVGTVRLNTAATSRIWNLALGLDQTDVVVNVAVNILWRDNVHRRAQVHIRRLVIESRDKRDTVDQTMGCSEDELVFDHSTRAINFAVLI